MKTNKIRCSQRGARIGMAPGFTMVELLIGLLVGGIALAGIFSVYINVIENRSPFSATWRTYSRT